MVGRHLHEPKGILAHALRLPSVRQANRECAEKAREFIEFVGLGSHMERTAGGLPYGGLKRLEIARALPASPSFCFSTSLPQAAIRWRRKRSTG